MADIESRHYFPLTLNKISGLPLDTPFCPDHPSITGKLCCTNHLPLIFYCGCCIQQLDCCPVKRLSGLAQLQQIDRKLNTDMLEMLRQLDELDESYSAMLNQLTCYMRTMDMERACLTYSLLLVGRWRVRKQVESFIEECSKLALEGLHQHSNPMEVKRKMAAQLRKVLCQQHKTYDQFFDRISQQVLKDSNKPSFLTKVGKKLLEVAENLTGRDPEFSRSETPQEKKHRQLSELLEDVERYLGGNRQILREEGRRNDLVRRIEEERRKEVLLYQEQLQRMRQRIRELEEQLSSKIPDENKPTEETVCYQNTTSSIIFEEEEHPSHKFRQLQTENSWLKKEICRLDSLIEQMQKDFQREHDQLFETIHALRETKDKMTQEMRQGKRPDRSNPPFRKLLSNLYSQRKRSESIQEQK